MGKRSRKERRTHQQERAVASGDVASLRALLDKGPRVAVPALVRALAAPPADPAQAAELDALALGVARQLRQAGELALALGLAAAGRRREPALRMEEALAAFASGRDEIAAEIAAADPAVAAALGPLLQAVRGEIVAATPGTPALRALHAVARGVGHVVRGEPDKAKAIVQRVTLAARRAVLGDEIIAAAELFQPGHVLAALRVLLASPRITPEVCRLMMAEALLDEAMLADPPRALRDEPSLRARILRAQMATATSRGAIVEIVRQAGPDAFDAPDRAAATLYHGFSLLRADPETASRSLDRAVQLGADLLEALRGRMLAGAELAGRYCEHHGGAPRGVREAAAAADRLARALERRPLAGPLAAAAGARAARYWLDADDPRAALAAIARARPLAGGKLVDDLDLLEADATAFRSPTEAEALLDALLARSPGYLDAWRLKRDLAVVHGEPERGAAILVEAAAVTKDPGFVAEARKLQAARGQLAPFQGFVPGAASAGALAAELDRATTEKDDPFPLAAAHRAALGPAARLAFDAAAIAVAHLRGTAATVEVRLRAAVLAWRHAPRDLARLIAAAAQIGVAGDVPAAARAVHDDPVAVRAMAEALVVAGYGKLVRKLLPSFAANLTREEVSFFKGVVANTRAVAIDGVPSPEQAVRELDLALAPELSILALLSEDDDDDDDDDDHHHHHGPSTDSIFELPAGAQPGDGRIYRSLLDAIGLPASAAQKVPPALLVQFETRLQKVAGMPPGPGILVELTRILKDLDRAALDAPHVHEPRPRRKR